MLPFLNTFGIEKKSNAQTIFLLKEMFPDDVLLSNVEFPAALQSPTEKEINLKSYLSRLPPSDLLDMYHQIYFSSAIHQIGGGSHNNDGAGAGLVIAFLVIVVTLLMRCGAAGDRRIINIIELFHSAKEEEKIPFLTHLLTTLTNQVNMAMGSMGITLSTVTVSGKSVTSSRCIQHLLPRG